PIPTDLNLTLPRLREHSGQLVDGLRRKSVKELQQLMGISEKLALLNAERYQSYTDTFSETNAKPAILMFKGDVYTGLEADTFTEAEMRFAQQHIRILSGLYGVLRPLDLIQAYRLEMGTKLRAGNYKNLYDFWGSTITEVLNEDLAASGGDEVINLASQEYFQAVKADQLKGKLIHIHFKENRNGQLKVISFNAKKARGRMAQLIVKEGVTTAENLKTLVVDGYTYFPGQSTESDWLFVK
ncbi:MAG: peroxide stress protein YaaA, partial [Bacteroidetes bacterium]